MAKQRLVEFDILRGLLIIAVVMGHAGVKTPWVDMQWFRMPAFFMVSGYFMRELCCDGSMLRRRARRLLVPYVAWSVVMWCLLHPEPLWKNVLRTVYGGGFNVTVYSFPWWFVNALMVSLIAFSFLRKAKSGGVILFVVICYALAHIQVIWRALPANLPWGIDEALGAIPFLWIGHMLRGRLQPRTGVPFGVGRWALALGGTLVVCAGFCASDTLLGWDYRLNMKSVIYTHWLLDLLVPLSFSYLAYLLSLLLARVPGVRSVLGYVGVACMTVFYIHACVLHVLRPLVGVWGAIVLAVVLGVALHALWSRWHWSRVVFLGEVSK